MKSKLDQVLDECIRAIRSGDSIADCLERYPQHTEALADLLPMASALSAIPVPTGSETARRESENRMLAAFYEKSGQTPVSKSFFVRYTERIQTTISDLFGNITGKELQKMNTKVQMIIAAVLVTVIVATTGVGVASANALPGQALYPLKNSIQQVRLFLTLDEQARGELEEKFRLEYLDDVRVVMEEGDEAEVKFYGVIEEIGEDYMVVDGITLRFNVNTVMPGNLAVGMLVEIEGYILEGGSLLATEISLEDMDDDFGDDSDDDDMDDDSSDDDDMDDDSSDDDDYDDDSSDDDYDDDSSSDDDYDDDSSDDDYDDDSSDDDYDDDSSDDDYDDDSSDDDYDDDSSDDDYDDDSSDDDYDDDSSDDDEDD
ncbi:MAG: DUF5666 domain-containing protein [Anaerolineae bacterium]|jgi:hypothetical protein|nr:DUF5666 domain-containing protein [Anaerolineae bacterium]